MYRHLPEDLGRRSKDEALEVTSVGGLHFNAVSGNVSRVS